MTALVKNHRHALVAFLVLFLHFSASSQLTARFTASPQNGCSPLVVNFSDQSTGNPTQWRWELGNGVISTLRNPSATYFNPGTYHIKLIVRNANGVDSVLKNQFITVNANPTIDFRASDTAGCFPLPVHFTDLSTPGTGTITSWQWDFGDGTLSTQKNPSHVYSNAGNYNVTLKVINNAGCLKTLSRVQHIKVQPGVRAEFSNSQAAICTAPVSVSFTNTSTGPGNLTYDWNFGDGNSSTQKNPTNNYSNNGNYTVTLVAISAQGCRDTVIKTNHLNIGTNKTDFSITDTICVNQPVVFTNNSAPTPSAVQWSFGDGSFSNSIHPSKAFSSIGTYTVKLVNNFGVCKDSISKQLVVVAAPEVDFTSDIRFGCDLPVTIQFQSQNSGNYPLLWNFGDGKTSTDANPVHTYNIEGNFTVTLTATNEAGCSITTTKKDWIKFKKPVVTISGLPVSGCVPVSVSVGAVISSGHNIQSYLWNFGDGSFSTVASPTYTYTQAGTFSISLVYTTTTGCLDSVVYTNAVRAGEKPKANFSVQPIDGCASIAKNFKDQSSGNVDSWYWDFGDSYTSFEQNPRHGYISIGWWTVTLVVSSNGCADTLVVNRAVHTKSPVASYNTVYSCENKSQVEFQDLSIQPKTWYWTFGDGTSSTEKSPIHIFPGPGTYSVALTVTNGNCTSTIFNPITIIEEKAIFIADSVTCSNTLTKFESTNLDSVNVSNWSWDFGDGTTADHSSSIYHSFDLPGIYTVTLTITDIKGCTEIHSQQVKVYGPDADFSLPVNYLCLLNNSITFTDESKTDGFHPIVKRIWDYGDGTVDSSSSAPYQHHFENAGSYDVSLTVTDDFGCSDKITKSAAVIVAQPKADFITEDTASCTSKNISFINTSNAIGPIYEWNFGDGTQSSIQHPSHNYSAIGNYNISLKITDQYGCADSITKTNYISISYPKAAFSMSDTFSTCPPLIINFSNHSTDYTSSNWDFGDGNFSTLNNPSHFYNTPGIYYPKLTVTGPGGCSESYSSRVEVKGPNGTVTYQIKEGCTPLSVTFTASTQNTSSFIWDFSDGTTLQTKDSVVTHTYSSPGDFIPKMILTDPSGCNFSIFGKDTIQVFSAAASFEVSTNNICDNGNIQFRNSTISNDFIAGYNWYFGDGSSSNLMDPLHHYNSLGSYAVKLVVTTMHGCKDSVSIADAIQVLESPIVSITGDSAACVPADFNFQGRVLRGTASTMTWNWDFANGNHFNGPVPTVQNYSTAGNYVITAIVTSANGCKDTAAKDITLHALPLTNAGSDIFICRGSVAQLKATGAATYVWENASLSCTNCPSPLAAPLDSTIYVVKGFTAFGCTASDSVVVRVHQPFVLSVQKGDTICVGESVELRAYGTDLFSWLPSSTVTDPNKGLTTARPSTSTTYQVIAKDKYNCFSDTAEVYVKVWSLPTVNAGVDQNIVVGNSTKLNSVYSNDVISWQWNNANSLNCFNCPVPVATPKQTTNYTIKVKNDGGCEATDQVKVFVTCNNGNLFIPNTFSPNADGVNDRFYPNGKGINMIKSLKVFNRWGEIVFERSNFSPNEISLGWDGTYKGQPLAPDVYVYICDVICQNNEVLTYKGDVTLLR